MKKLTSQQMRAVFGGMNKTELVKAIAGKANSQTTVLPDQTVESDPPA